MPTKHTHVHTQREIEREGNVIRNGFLFTNEERERGERRGIDRDKGEKEGEGG